MTSPAPGEIDEAKYRAYKLSLGADEALSKGYLELAERLFQEAANLDQTYSVRARLATSKDERRVRVGPTLKKQLISFLRASGFSPEPPESKSHAGFFVRISGERRDAVLVAISRFGGAIAVHASRVFGNEGEWFDWRLVNNRTESLTYKTQLELEAVVNEWCRLLKDVVFPWFESGVRPVA